MPRYFFDSIVDGVLVDDDVGHEAVGAEAIRLEALRGLAGISLDEVPNGVREIEIAVRDGDGNNVYCARLSLWEQNR